MNKSPIQLIHTGATHTIAINSKGKLFSWGWNSYGQCGHPFYSKHIYLLHFYLASYSDMIIPDIKKDKKGNIPSIPVINYLPSGKTIQHEDISNVKSIVCGEDISFVLDEQGNAFAFGNNDRGQLGLGNVWEIEKPRLIADLKGKVKDIKSTGDINLAITTNNELFVWPFETFKQNYKPLRLYLDKKIILGSISCGKNFAMLLSKSGVIYSFGKKNNKGELGTGDLKPRLIPEPIYVLSDNGEKITQVSCGFKHSVAVSSSGKAFTWGNVK
jgi:alpha-tubulin suppressor-like RCC1 family protein